MELFIGNLHLDTTTNELKALLADIDKEACISFVEQNRHNGKLRFGHVAEMNDDKALYIITSLHNKPHRGRKLIVRQFHQRTNNNDHRKSKHEPEKTWYGLEKRVAERRALIIEEKNI